MEECYSEIKSFLAQNSGNGNASVQYDTERPPPAIILKTPGFGFLFFRSGKVVITGNHPVAKHVSVLRFFWANCLKMHVKEK
jgi:TATA-box binding protein (TBP) (component of TFIID and TFIIIB)